MNKKATSPITFFYRVYTTFATTGQLEHTGTYEGVLLRARRVAEESFKDWERGQGPYIIIQNGRTGETREVRL